jgi:hypothetical protein
MQTTRVYDERKEPRISGLFIFASICFSSRDDGSTVSKPPLVNE